MNLKRLVPWWAKIALKLGMSRLPIPYAVWQKANIFVHGAMHQEEYAWRVMQSHLERTGMRSLAGATVLEFGPGDSLFTAVIAHSLGASRVWLVDAGPFARGDVEPYRRMSAFLMSRGLPAADVEGARGIDDVLERTHATYLTTGVESLRSIPSSSVDLIFSQAVLEHVRLAEAGAAIAELARILSPGGTMSHQIDLKDHLGGALHNLRFSDALWEGPLFTTAGFYTNRVRFHGFLDLFDRADLQYDVTNICRWSALPTPRKSMHRRFAELSDDELLVSQFDIVARRGPGGETLKRKSGSE